jgi:hypothetical protein
MLSKFYGVRWQSAAATPLLRASFDIERLASERKSGVALRFPPQSIKLRVYMRIAGHFLSVLWATLVCAFCVDIPPDVKLFALTQPTLRTSALPIERSQIAAPPVEVTLTREAPIELLTQRYETMTGTPLLYRPPTPHEPAGALGFLQTKVFNPIFDMESVKLGKVHLTGGIVNAVKKKNPLCLLNPFVFAMDW